jgi:hypothetical protein
LVAGNPKFASGWELMATDLAFVAVHPLALVTVSVTMYVPAAA